jgi:hypothetical protein
MGPTLIINDALIDEIYSIVSGADNKAEQEATKAAISDWLHDGGISYMDNVNTLADDFAEFYYQEEQ